MPTNNYVPARRMRNSWSEPSSVRPEVLPGPRPRGHWAVGRRSELDGQLDGLDHDLNPLELSSHLT